MKICDEKLLSVSNSDLDSSGHFNVPEEIKVITRNAFKNATKLRSLRLSKKLELIEQYAFITNIELVEMDFPNGKIEFEACKLDCPNLNKICIDSDICYISNDIIRFFAIHDIEDVEFYFYDKVVTYHLESNFSYIDKVKNNRFILYEDNNNEGVIIDNKFVKKVDYSELSKMFNYASLNFFLEDYQYVLSHRADLMYEWGKVISAFKDKNRFYPDPAAIMAIPATKKDIYKYFLNQKNLTLLSTPILIMMILKNKLVL